MPMSTEISLLARFIDMNLMIEALIQNYSYVVELKLGESQVKKC